MSMIWATTGAVAAREEGSDFTVNMDGRVIELDLFGIPKGSRYTSKQAKDFIRYRQQHQFAGQYGGFPTQRSYTQIIPVPIDG